VAVLYIGRTVPNGEAIKLTKCAETAYRPEIEADKTEDLCWCFPPEDYVIFCRLKSVLFNIPEQGYVQNTSLIHYIKSSR
jgi:hypothetical protein